MKNTAFMYLVGYDEGFKKAVKSGWGCGYVAIPAESEIVKTHFANIDAAQSETDYYVSDYLQIGDQEITYTRTETVNGVDYLVIGFDTAHSYNTPATHNFEYVFKETHDLLTKVNELLNA